MASAKTPSIVAPAKLLDGSGEYVPAGTSNQPALGSSWVRVWGTITGSRHLPNTPTASVEVGAASKVLNALPKYTCGGNMPSGEDAKKAINAYKDLEKTYNALNREYERSTERADAVHKRIKEMETVAADLFAEWEKEIQQISSAKLQESDREKLQETHRRYDELHAALKRAERSMDPVLTRFHDQVLYLKHNLNAAAIASLKGEAISIQTEIGRLLDDMNASILRADEFIKGLPQ